MYITIIWNCWGLPFGYSSGIEEKDWDWAFSIGPIHLIKRATNIGES